MPFTSRTKRILVSLLVLVSIGAFASIATANHSWGNYHWARTVNPLALKLGDNLSPAWDVHLTESSGNWSVSSVLETTVVPGMNLRNCKPVNGRVEICNKKYGNNGWLGIASVWANGDHITQGTVKLNDTYFNTAKYNTPAWKNLVMCQEIGHAFGLDHQDENFTNTPLGTCMDYTDDPTPNQHPDQHDYDQLETIYGHLDTTTTASTIITQGNGKNDIDLNEQKQWGKIVRTSHDGHNALYERDLGKGQKIFTFVVWAN